MEVVITVVHYIMSLGMIKMIVEDMHRESLWVEFCLGCFCWAHTLTTMDMEAAQHRKCCFLGGCRGVKCGLRFLWVWFFVQRVLVCWAGASQLHVGGKSKDSVSGIVSEFTLTWWEHGGLTKSMSSVIFLQLMSLKNKQTGETRLKVKAVQTHTVSKQENTFTPVVDDLTFYKT